MESFAIRGFNPCESLLRHTPEQLRRFIRRMKTLKMNTIIIHYDYGWKRYKDLILEECSAANINIILMTFGPRTFFRYSNWKKEWFAKDLTGRPYCSNLECETYPCRFEKEALEAYAYGVKEWLKSLPPQIKHVHMRAADGLMFCQCEKCRKLTDHEKWQPFVDIFAETVTNTRPDLVFETDIYVKRYHIPENHTAFRNMKNIMYDTFFRNPNFPLGFNGYQCGDLTHAKTVYDSDSVSTTVNEYHLARLKEWTGTFPGKVYIHENAMTQGFHGILMHNTSMILKDLETYRRLGVQGGCFEAYEPGYVNFESFFENVASALNGGEIDWRETPLEKFRRENDINIAWSGVEDDVIDKYITDPMKNLHIKYFRNYLNTPTLKNAKAYMKFAFEHEAILDPVYISHGILTSGLCNKAYYYRDLTAEEQDYLTRRKLWDFMEDIPVEQEPIAVCKRIALGIMAKAVEN